MTWTIVLLILMSLVKIVLTCLPTGVMEWLLSKFAVHAKLSDENAVLSWMENVSKVKRNRK